MKIGIYFLFYVAMILELLIFIVDRDDAEDQLRYTYREYATIDSLLAEQCKESLRLTCPAETNVPLYVITRNGNAYQKKTVTARVTITVVGLWSDVERATVRYWMQEKGKSPVALRTDPVTGNAVFERAFEREGTYEFAVWGSVIRVLPDYLPVEVRNSVIKDLSRDNMLGPSLEVHSDQQTFRVNVVKNEVPIPPC